MALFSRYKTAVGAGTLAAFLLVAIFGSPWYRDWAANNTNPNTAGGWFLRLLGWPRGRSTAATPSRTSSPPPRHPGGGAVRALPLHAPRRAVGSRPGHVEPVLRGVGRVHLRRRIRGPSYDAHQVEPIAARGVPLRGRSRDVRPVRRLGDRPGHTRRAAYSLTRRRHQYRARSSRLSGFGRAHPCPRRVQSTLSTRWRLTTPTTRSPSSTRAKSASAVSIAASAS